MQNSLDESMMWQTLHEFCVGQISVISMLKKEWISKQDFFGLSSVARVQGTLVQNTWYGYKITGLNFFLLPCKLGNS